MAKIYKVSAYLVDANDNHESVDELMAYLENQKYSPTIMLTDSAVKEFEWDDDVPVNQFDCTQEQADEFFDSIK